MSEQPARPDGVIGSELPGPFAVGRYANELRDFLRQRPRVQVFGEVWNFKLARTRAFFELRDTDGALPCGIWRTKLEGMGLPVEGLTDGAQVVIAGGLDYYPGSRTASPGFSFDVSALRLAGEGDLLAQLVELRRRLDAEGLFEPQKALPRPSLPRTIGVVTGESGKARDDVLAALRRRGWAGRLVWAFAPVQDRRAAPAITQALQDLAAIDEVDVVIVARGGGSLADLFAFCDETLCRTVALLRVPGDRERRPPHRPDADRRRRSRQLLDPDARRRGGGPARPRGRARASAARRAASGPARTGGDRAAGAPSGRPGPRARRAHRAPPPRAAPDAP